MIAYRDLLFTMIVVFSLLTVILSPAFFFFAKNDGIRPEIQKPYVKYSLGNMGYSTSQCSLIPLGAGDSIQDIQIPLQCPFGDFTNAYSYGVNPAELLPNNFCAVSEEGGDASNSVCAPFIDKAYIDE